MKAIGEVSFSTPNLPGERYDEVKSRSMADTPGVNQSTDDLAGQSPVNIRKGREHARAEQLRRTISSTSLRAAAHLHGAGASTVASTLAPRLNELARHVSTVNLQTSVGKHKIRSELLRKQTVNSRTDKTKERILFAKYKAENDMLPGDRRKTDEDVFRRAAEDAFILVDHHAGDDRHKALVEIYRQTGMRKTHAIVAARIASFAYPILNMAQGVMPESLKHRQALRRNRAELNTRMNLARAEGNEPDAEHKRSNSFGFTSPVDNPELYENRDDALLNEGPSQAETAMPTPVSQLEQLGALVAENGMAKVLTMMSEAQLDAFAGYMDGKITLDSLERPQRA